MRAVPRIAGRARPEAQPADAATGDAWRVLDAVSAGITFADAKAGVLLAVAGVIGGVLADLERGHPNVLGRCAAVLCGTLVFASAVCAGMALRPRRRTAAPSGLIYFGHIADRAPAACDAYVEELGELLRDRTRLAGQIGSQIWASSVIAKAKYDWVDRALLLLLGALFMLGATAVVSAVS